MTDKQILGGGVLNVGVAYWGHCFLSNIGNSEGNKVKIIDSHPTRPIVVSVDGEGRIVIDDFNLKKNVLIMSVGDILNCISGSLNKRSLTKKTSQNFFMKQRLSSRNNSGIQNTKVFRPDAKLLVHGLVPPMKSKGHTTQIIHQLSFVDSSTIAMSSHFCPGTKILVVFEHQVVVFDYCTRSGFVLNETDLSKSPVSAEFISINVLAIGCVDGSIRLWDCKFGGSSGGSGGSGGSGVVKSLNGHSKGPVNVLKTVPLVGGNCGISSSSEVDRVRLISFGADGAVLIWDLCISAADTGALTVDIESSTSNGLPTARLKESLGVSSSGLSRANVQYDQETNNLLVCTGDRRIKIWDLGEVRQAQSQHKAQSIQQAKTAAAKRASVLMSVVGGGSGRDGHYADIFGISCVATVKPGDKRDRRIEVAAFAPLNSPLFPSDTFILCSKNNSVGIYKSRESHSGDDKSERSSVAGSTNERSQRLQLLHEFSLNSLVENYASSLTSLSEGIRELPKAAAALKVYSLRVHAAQSHIIALATSVGMVVLTLPVSLSGAFNGCHPCWGPTKLLFVNNTVRKVVLDGADLDRLQSRASMGDMLGDESVGEVSIDVICDLPLGDGALPVEVASGRTGSVLGGKRMSFNPPSARRLGAPPVPSETLSSKPTFHPSPSGSYCALVWRDTMLYLILKMGECPSFVPASSSGRHDAALSEVDRGYCTSFAWVGTHDCYLIRSPPHVASIAAPKAKRSSIMGGLFGSEKEVKKLVRAELRLFQCAAGETQVRRLPLEAQNLFNGAECAVIEMQSGPIVNFNLAVVAAQSLPKKESGVVAGDVAAADLPRDSEGIEMEMENAVAALSPPRSAMLSRFFCLVTTSEAGRLKVAKSESKLQKPKKIKDSVSAGDDVPLESPTVGSDDSSSLCVVGPIMSAVDAVRWDYCSGRCAVLMGQETISILQLSTGSRSFGSVTLSAVATLNLASPINSFQTINSFLWDQNQLLLTATCGIMAFSFASLAVDGQNSVNVSLVQDSADSSRSAPWSEIVGLHHGQVYVNSRNGLLSNTLLERSQSHSSHF